MSGMCSALEMFGALIREPGVSVAEYGLAKARTGSTSSPKGQTGSGTPISYRTSFSIFYFKA